MSTYEISLTDIRDHNKSERFLPNGFKFHVECRNEDNEIEGYTDFEVTGYNPLLDLYTLEAKTGEGANEMVQTIFYRLSTMEFVTFKEYELLIEEYKNSYSRFKFPQNISLGRQLQDGYTFTYLSHSEYDCPAYQIVYRVIGYEPITGLYLVKAVDFDIEGKFNLETLSLVEVKIND